MYAASLLCICFILLGSATMALADAKTEPGSNLSPVIISFSAASPVKDDLIHFTLNKTSKYSKNESIEAYYNNMSEETDTSLPRLVFLGIPMECHFCMNVPVLTHLRLS
jgi:hypothetical protein